jgi:iron complex transport system permease protein
VTVPAWKWYASVGLIAALFAAELFLGSVTLTAADVWLALKGGHPDDVSALIVKRVRLPRAFTALLGGGGLALCGLLMQAFFQNPLAGPGVLGISSGAGLGVAVVVMAGSVGMVAPVSIVAAAFIGAMAVLALILLFSKRMRSPVTLLIFGLMVGYLVSSLVTILQAGSTSEALRSFVFWGMGSFADRSASELYLMTALLVPGAVVAYSLHRQLDLWSLGEDYARTSGLNVGRFRVAVLVVSGLMTAAVTAFCGPIAFIGLAVPHLARGVWQSGRHAVLIPSVVFSGMIVGLACDLIVRLPAGSIPLNAVTSIFGAPVVIALLLKGRRVF